MVKQNYSHLVFILDRSGSMASIESETIEGFNKLIADQQAGEGEATLTLALFDDQYELIHDFVNIKNVPKLGNETYSARGFTALRDAVGKTINSVGNKLANMKEEDRPSKVVVTIMTDGAENQSREFSAAQIKEMVEHQKSKYNWQIILIGANIDSITVGGELGVTQAQSYSYKASAVGTRNLYSSVSAGMSTFRNSANNATFNMVNPIDMDDDINANDFDKSISGSLSSQNSILIGQTSIAGSSEATDKLSQ
jgi:uncharacterized protein YegL